MVKVCCTKCGTVYEFAEEKSGSAVSFCGKCQTMFSYAMGRALYEARHGGGDRSGPQRVSSMPRSTCPKCGAVLQLTDDMVNEEIECGSCRAVFVARPDPPASRRGETDRPSRRRMSDPDEEERPSRRRGEEEVDDQPRRRRTRDADDEEDRPRARSNSNGLALGGFITSLASAIVFILGCFFSAVCCLPGWSVGTVISIVGLVLSLLALKKPTGKGFAVAGSIISGVVILASIVVFVLMLLGVGVAALNRPPANNPPFGPQRNNNPPFGPQRNNPPPPWRR